MVLRILLIICFFSTLFITFFTSSSSATQDDLAGVWIGQWEREGSNLDVEIVFTHKDAGYTGNFSSAQLRVVGIPFERINYKSPQVAWSLVGDATTIRFEGILTGDILKGRFQEEGASGTFHLTRSKTATTPIQEYEITFNNGNVKLSGSVLRPVGSGPFPAVVFLHGSGAEGRWGSRYLANAFARNGIAALIYDKRGVGASTGDWRQVGFEELAGDAVAAVEILRTQTGIDPTRVGIHGHSQGGTIAPWVANESSHIAFVIGSAASGVSMVEAETYSLSNYIGVRGLPESERPLAERFVQAIVEHAYSGSTREQLDRVWQTVRDRPWAFEPPAESNFYWVFSRRTASYRPLEQWRRVVVPTLLVYGENDERVPPRKSAAQIAEAFLGARGNRLDVLFFPSADHTFRLQTNNGGKFQWPRSASGYPEEIIQWVKKVTNK